MISPETIERIREAMRVEEVVGEFVSLRKRGANMVGLCPFHNEKTPSFHVNPVKGIFKCFGCGEGGNAIDFLIKYDHLNYVEALRWLAKKYNIEIEEETLTEEQTEVFELRERLFNLNSFAANWFAEQLESDEGAAIALSYCRERGITDESIQKFKIGFSPRGYDAFSVHAQKNGYDKDILVDGGLSVERNGELVDKFRERLIFPIHNLSGRVIGFGARLLSSEPKRPKYLNSPETEVYQKSKSLYGIYQSRSAIAKADNCYLVEGYTDVIALYQAGINNVVASSGTALTEEQIRLIRRYSLNITIIFDGDPAGIKASFRGIDMILGEGMNVRIVPMPDGSDPDSFVKQRSSEEVTEYLKNQNDDFITFKANLLMAEADGDPVKIGNFVREIIWSVALIPDPLLRPLFVKKCAEITNTEEEILVFELNKRLRQLRQKKQGVPPFEAEVDLTRVAASQQKGSLKPLIEYQEEDIIRLLVIYGAVDITLTHEDGETSTTTLGKEITDELLVDDVTFSNPLWQAIFDEFKNAIESGSELPCQDWFIHHQNSEIREAAVDFISTPYELSKNWDKLNIEVAEEKELLPQTVDTVLYSFRLRKIEEMMDGLQGKLVNVEDDDEAAELLNRYNKLMKSRNMLAEFLGRTISF